MCVYYVRDCKIRGEAIPDTTLTLLTWLDNPNYEAEALLQKSKIRKQIMPSWYERLSRKPNVAAATPFCFQKSEHGTWHQIGFSSQKRLALFHAQRGANFTCALIDEWHTCENKRQIKATFCGIAALFYFYVAFLLIFFWSFETKA